MNYLQMTPYQFDQADDGWRSIDRAGDYIGAAELIVRYIDENSNKLTTNPSIETLYFHAGQEYAMAGNRYYDQAMMCFRKSFKGDKKWDYYVRGTIAFLQRDKHGVQLAIQSNAHNEDILWRFHEALCRADYSYGSNY